MTAYADRSAGAGDGFEVAEGITGAPSVGGLFHSEEFFALHAGLDPREAAYFRLSRRGRTCAAVHFTHLGDGLWRSPGRGTFAGWAWEPDLLPEHLDAFVGDVEQRLESRGARRLAVAPQTMSHDPGSFSLIFHLLHARGWSVSEALVDQAIAVDDRPLASHLGNGNLGRLRRCARAGLLSGPVAARRAGEVHGVIVANAAAKGRTVSMGLDGLQRMIDVLPHAVHLFGTWDGERLAAAAICLRVSPDALNVFAWGHHPDYSASSPVVQLAEAIYDFCRADGIRLMDIGTSPQGDFGLLGFKRRLGCSTSLKVSMTKDVPRRLEPPS